MKNLISLLAVSGLMFFASCSSSTETTETVESPANTEQPAQAPANTEQPAQAPAETPAADSTSTEAVKTQEPGS